MKRELKGRKVKGFYFESRKYGGLGYITEMNGHIGKVGLITNYNFLTNSYDVEFDNTRRAYPAELIEQHLVSDNPLDSLPMLGEGVLCEVWNNDKNPVIRFVCARTPNGYLFWNNTNKKEDINYKGVTYCNTASPIEPVKQYTKEQLEEMVGHKFELI